MVCNLIIPPGEPVDIDELSVQKAAELVDALQRQSIDYTDFIECRVTDDGEVVVFDVEVELPQVRIHSIERRERIATVFFSEDITYPEVFALREDFPRVPHLNLRTEELPRSLCLYYEPYRDIKRRWTPSRFVSRVREWLALTAKGRLHPEDQPLEPILMDPDGILFIPSEAFSSNQSETPLRIIPLRHTTDRNESGEAIPIILKSTEQEHGVIHHRPQTLADLSSMLDSEGFEVLPEVRNRLHDWQNKDETFLNANLVLIIGFPKTRVRGGPVEAIETWAFQTRIMEGETRSIPAPIRIVGESLGVWDIHESQVGLLVPMDTSKRGENILLEVLNPIYSMDAATLSNLNNQNLTTEQPKICAIGVGALGSQVVMNLARAGFGRWSLIDDDLLMPHNVARHYLPGGEFVGSPKSKAVAFCANLLTDGEDLFKAIPANIFFPGDQQAGILSSFSNADAILDISASVSVARYLSISEDSTARRLSVFMTPTGADLVLLAEDEQRTTKLDTLEMQYYRACVHDKRLEGHLESSPTHLRYGQSCRDLTSRLPQHLVALHAAMAAKAIMDVMAKPEAQLAIWRSHDNDSVTRIDMPPAQTIRMQFRDWSVVADDGIFARLHELRQRKLPNETGGVLLGSVDVDQRIIYIVDTSPSPPDSEEWPTLYIRGRRGLQPKVDEITAITDGMIEYIGEWHSHPQGVPTIPSDDDIKVFAWITELMDRDGLPALMMIVGDEDEISCFVTKIEQVENLFPTKGAQ